MPCALEFRRIIIIMHELQQNFCQRNHDHGHNYNYAHDLYCAAAGPKQLLRTSPLGQFAIIAVHHTYTYAIRVIKLD